MEADWEIELGGDAPVIERCWPGLVDLASQPELAAGLEEAGMLPGLAQALAQLNEPRQAVSTSKCDVWWMASGEGLPAGQMTPGELDADEYGAAVSEVAFARCCYVDCAPRLEQVWTTAAEAEHWARKAVERSRAAEASCCRAEFVVRGAVAGQAEGFAVTMYVTGTGSSRRAATAALDRAIQVAARSLAGIAVVCPTAGSIQPTHVRIE